LKDDISSKELALEYPCIWCYKVIISADNDMETISKRVLHEREYSVKLSRSSQKNSYKSYDLELLVFSDEDRKSLFKALKMDIDIKFVL
jgi:putative lipoic acid-binding regulatory protein